MNELTKRVVTKTVDEYKYLAKQNDYDFRCKVEQAYWIEIHSLITVELLYRFYHLMSVLYPECMDDDELPKSYKLEERISDKLISMVNRVIDRHWWLQLDDYGDLPQRLAQPQMKLF